MQQILIAASISLCIFVNIVASRYGYSNIITGDKDILLPFSIMIFLFYPLLIYLPETHYKVITYGQTQQTTLKQMEQDEEDTFPFAFLITLGSITTCIILHRLVLFNRYCIEGEPTKAKAAAQMQAKMEGHISQILKYFLSLAIGLYNIVAAFYITIQDSFSIVRNQLIIFGLFSVIINFAYGYISGWSAVSKDMNDRLSNFINCGLILGFLLGLIVEDNLIMLVLPCFCCGLMMYSSTLVGLPILYSNGENHAQDKFRYGSIFTSLLLTVVYHPLCYLLRV